MSSTFDTWEIILYGIVVTVPCVLLAAYTFRDDFRYSMKTMIPAAIVLCAVQVLLNAGIEFFPRSMYVWSDFLRGAVYLGFLLLMIKEPAGKVLFFLIALSNFSNYFVIMGKFIESRFSREMALMRYNWTYAVCVLAVECIFLPILYYLLFKPLAELKTSDSERRMWLYLCLVPATFTVFWVVWFYGDAEPALYRCMTYSYWIVKLATDIGALIIYRLIVMLMREQEKNLRLSEESYEQSLELAQYNSMRDTLERARVLRHDLRHHMNAIYGYAEEAGNEEIMDYIDGIMEQSRLQEPLRVCENPAANYMLQHYIIEASEQGIKMNVNFSMPQDFFMKPMDVTILLGNLLKNAMDACVRERPDEPYISVKGRMQTDSIFVMSVSNPSNEAAPKDAAGHILSHNHPGRGIGVNSISSIVKRYGGVAHFSREGGVFTAEIMVSKQ